MLWLQRFRSGPDVMLAQTSTQLCSSFPVLLCRFENDRVPLRRQRDTECGHFSSRQRCSLPPGREASHLQWMLLALICGQRVGPILAAAGVAVAHTKLRPTGGSSVWEATEVDARLKGRNTHLRALRETRSLH